MGTRGGITFKHARDKFNKGIIVCNLYKQYDSYLEGLGADLCAFMKEGVFVNGFGSSDKRNIFNGIGDLAARTIHMLKDEGNGTSSIGNLYLEEKPCKDNDYYYEICEIENDPTIYISVYNWKKLIYDGTIDGLSSFIEEQKKKKEAE